MLEKELEFFKQHKDEYLKAYQGQYVVISGDTFIGNFTTEQQAYEAGVKRVGVNKAFLVKRVLPEDRQESIPAYTLGLLRI